MHPSSFLVATETPVYRASTVVQPLVTKLTRRSLAHGKNPRVNTYTRTECVW
jgi:hypothetical protein